MATINNASHMFRESHTTKTCTEKQNGWLPGNLQKKNNLSNY